MHSAQGLTVGRDVCKTIPSQKEVAPSGRSPRARCEALVDAVPPLYAESLAASADRSGTQGLGTV